MRSANKCEQGPSASRSMFSGFKSLQTAQHEDIKMQLKHKIAILEPVDNVRRVKLTNGASDLRTVAAGGREMGRKWAKNRGVELQFAAAQAEYAAVLEVEKEFPTAAVIHDKVADGS
jgi:hypothetical protein